MPVEAPILRPYSAPLLTGPMPLVPATFGVEEVEGGLGADGREAAGREGVRAGAEAAGREAGAELREGAEDREGAEARVGVAAAGGLGLEGLSFRP